MIRPENIKYQGEKVSDETVLKKLPEDLQDLLKTINGFIAFDGGLHIRGIVGFPEWHSLQKVWFGDFALHEHFPSLKATDVPFAQDCLGDQFVLRDGKVWRLIAETGELESLDLSLKEFLAEAEKKSMEFLSLQPLATFISEGGKMENGQLLNAYPPFCTNESIRGVSLKAVPMFERISFLADLAKQIKDL